MKRVLSHLGKLAGFCAAALALLTGICLADTVVADAGALVRAYPEVLDRADGNAIVWRDGTRMPFDDGKGVKPFEIWLAQPDLEDMIRMPYPAGGEALPPALETDPGRARNMPFFDKMYGNCRRGEVVRTLDTIVWLPKKAPQKLKVSRVNGVAQRLAAVSSELDALPSSFDKFLIPSAGTYNCRLIAGTDRLSAHGHGIAIDIASAQSDYWRWAAKGNPRERDPVPFRNRIPLEIVRIFEKHGFIWGGRWHHYDTMHFEYRPELLPPLAPLPGGAAP